MEAKKIVLFTSLAKVDVYRKYLPGQDIEVIEEPRPMFFNLLMDYDAEGFEIFILDDTAVAEEDITQMEASVCRFMLSPRARSSRLRIIFSARAERGERDGFISRLVDYGVYDIILPARGQSDASLLFELVGKPAKLGDVVTLRNPNAMRPVFGSDRAPVLKSATPTTDVIRTLSLTGNRTIAVGGFTIRSGCTTVALAMARALTLAGYTVCVAMARKESFDRLQDMYRAAVSDDGGFSLGGIDFFYGTKLSDTNQVAQFTIFDLGQIELRETDSLKITKSAAYQELRRMANLWMAADCKVLVGGAQQYEIPMWEDILKANRINDVNKWNLVFNLADEKRMMPRVKKDIAASYPRATVCASHEMPSPLYLLEIPGFVQDIVKASFREELEITPELARAIERKRQQEAPKQAEVEVETQPEGAAEDRCKGLFGRRAR